MNDFDKLTTENPCDDAIISVIEPKAQETVAPERKPDILAAIWATVRGDKELINSYEKRRLPYLKYTFLSVIAMFAVSVIVLIMNFFVGYKMLIPIVSVLFCAFPPTVSVIFFYELNVDGKLSGFTVFICFLLGFFAYVLMNFVASFFYQFVAKESIEQIGFPIILALICFLNTFVVSNSIKTRSIGDCLLIAAAVLMGFCFTNNLVNTFDKLFVVDGIVTTGTYNAPPGAGVIIGTSEFLKGNFDNIFDNWLFDYIILPYLYSCWAVVNGYLVAVSNEGKIKKREAPKSLYLILMLVMLMNFIAVFDTAIDYLGIILKASVLVASTILAITFINSYLQE